METALIILIGIVVGVTSAWFIAKYKYEGQRGITKEELDSKYISKELYNETKAVFEQKEEERNELNRTLAKTEQININLKEKLEDQKKEIEKIHETFKTEFENLATKILKQNTVEFAETNQKKLAEILNPLKEKITTFEKKVEETYVKGTRERSALVKQIESLAELNKQMSEDASNLTKALKGDSQALGSWGELRLELILEKAGLVKDIHYTTQETFRDEEGVLKKPDFIINLPDNKHLIIDSKVSLNAYEAYYNCDDEKEKKIYLKKHLESIREHIKDLSSKKYQNLYQINTPDYVLMYIPIDSAFILALQNDENLYDDALKRNIALVTSFTLLPTLSTVSSIWKQEDQKKNVLEIARQSGALYDKFKNFIDDLLDIGKRMDSAKTAYEKAMNKLSTGSGNLISKVEKIKKLGAKTTKSMPQTILDRAFDVEETDKTNLIIEEEQKEQDE